MVATPSSRRGTAACRSAGWNAAAKQKVIPASSPIRATLAPGRSSRMPSASSTSAEPALDEADRLPCLTTGAPAPAATIAAMVEMFTDIDRSPPVPTTSSTRPRTVSGVACAYIAVDEALELVDGLALGAQRDREAGDLGRRGLPGEDLRHRPGGLVAAQVLATGSGR